MKDYLLTVLVIVSNTLPNVYSDQIHFPLICVMPAKDVPPCPSFVKIQAEHKNSRVKRPVDEFNQTKSIKADSYEELPKPSSSEFLWEWREWGDKFTRWDPISSQIYLTTMYNLPVAVLVAHGCLPNISLPLCSDYQLNSSVPVFKTEEDKLVYNKSLNKRSTIEVHESTENPRWKSFFEKISKDSKRDSSTVFNDSIFYVDFEPFNTIQPTKDDKLKINTTEPTEAHKPEINTTEPTEDQQSFVTFNFTSSLEKLNKFHDPKNFMGEDPLNISHISDTLLNERLKNKQPNVSFIDLVLPNGFNLNEFLEKEKFMDEDFCHDARIEKVWMFRIAFHLKLDYSSLINHAEICLQFLDIIKLTINIRQKRYIQSTECYTNDEIDTVVAKLRNMLKIIHKNKAIKGPFDTTKEPVYV